MLYSGQVLGKVCNSFFALIRYSISIETESSVINSVKVLQTLQNENAFPTMSPPAPMPIVVVFNKLYGLAYLPKPSASSSSTWDGGVGRGDEKHIFNRRINDFFST